MKILGLGVPELVIILVVILLIFGPKNLPKLGSAIGKSVKNLRDGMGADKELEDASDEETEAAPAPEPAKAEEAKTEAAPKKTVKKVVKKAEPKEDAGSDKE